MEKFTQAPVGLDIDQTVSSNSTAISKLMSDANRTNDILASAVNCTETSFFSGSGNSYTGSVPNANYGYGTFLVTVRGILRFVIAFSQTNALAINEYTGSAWRGWRELVSKNGVEYLTITPVTGIEIDSNRSNICGDHGVIAVTCHATQDLGNHAVFDFDKVSKTAERSSIFVIGTGQRWTVTGVAYCYLADHGVSINGITSGTYYHIYFPITKES